MEHNLAEGILYEISQDAAIRYNQVHRNGFQAKGWYWDGGITVASSFNVEVYGNRLSGNYNGITGTKQDRPDSTPPQHLLDHYQVHDNLICATGHGGTHRRGGWQRRRPGHPRHQLQPQHRPVGHLPVAAHRLHVPAVCARVNDRPGETTAHEGSQ